LSLWFHKVSPLIRVVHIHTTHTLALKNERSSVCWHFEGEHKFNFK
jgi:hypothetical protein